MPCSLCQNNGHNRRSAACPVNIANRSRQRPTAELRPRTSTVPVGINEPTDSSTSSGPTSREMNLPGPEHTQLPQDEQLNAYMLLYKNMRPVRQYEHPTTGYKYNIHRLLVIPGRLNIPECYIRPSDNKVVLRRIGEVYFTAIGVRQGNSMRILNSSPLPDTNELYVFIPQIPGFNIPIANQDASARIMFEDHITQMTYEINDNDKTEPSCENTCAVCLDTINHEHIVRTNCSHTYCAVCFSKYIKSQHAKFKLLSCIPNNIVELPCPLCRTNITKLVFNTPEQHYLMRIFMSDEILL
jgi:hypothetical protein